MSATIDVLTAIDRLIGNARTMAGLTGDPKLRENLREAEQARTAVAELINTANRVWSKGGAVTGGEWDELGNALARVGGAA